MVDTLVFIRFKGFFLQPATGFGERSFDEASWSSVLKLSQYPQERGSCGHGWSLGLRGRPNHDLLDSDKIKDDVGCGDDSKRSHEDQPGTLHSHFKETAVFLGGICFLIWCYLSLRNTARWDNGCEWVQVYVKISALFRVAPDAYPFSSLSDRLKDCRWYVGWLPC